MTNERRWRATKSVQGPAWKRYLERNPPTKIRGLTEREQAIVNKNMRDRALWQKIMSALPSLFVFTLWLAPPLSRKGIEDEKESKWAPPSMKEQHLVTLKHLADGLLIPPLFLFSSFPPHQPISISCDQFRQNLRKEDR